MEPDQAVLTRPFLVQNDPVAAPGFALPVGTVTFLLTDIEVPSRRRPTTRWPGGRRCEGSG
jgi:hypothetical protein